MKDPRSIMEVALRVLASWTTGRSPNPIDERELREFAKDDASELDDLACRIVNGALKKPLAEGKAANGN